MASLHDYDKLLFDEMRLVRCLPSDAPGTPEDFQRAMTANENLASYGFTLLPSGIALLATCDPDEQKRLVDTVASCVDQVRSSPMFPDFPKQVMEMGEAEYRFAQLLHYASTYGIEELSGTEVRTGWLPDATPTPKTLGRERLLDLKALEIVDERERYTVPARRIIGKCERMSGPERDILGIVCEMCPTAELLALLETTPVPFKENLMPIAFTLAESLDPGTAQRAIATICQHTGDVLKCARYALARRSYHFGKPMKRLWISCLEAYPIDDFVANISLSRKKARGALLVARFLDYHRLSRSDAHKQALRDLSAGKLRSWESRMKRLLREDRACALSEIAKRPGMLLRWYRWLARLGFPPTELANALAAGAPSLSVRTLVSVIQELRGEGEGLDAPLLSVLEARLRSLDTPLAGQRVFLDAQSYALDRSTIGASPEGGYVRAGLAMRIPDDVQRLRFFVYWNDPARVDVDLHSYGVTTDRRFVHVGWNAGYDLEGIVTSGDITHSDAAEYIDVDLAATQCLVVANCLHLYYGKSSFGEIETCLVGLMAVNEIGEEHALYDPKNCFFSHRLRHKGRRLLYCAIDVPRRVVALLLLDVGYDDFAKHLANAIDTETSFTVQEYLDLLVRAQNASYADSREEADLTLTMEHAEGAISLLDADFFMDA